MIQNGRIAIFGGTFNPIHFGHLRVAEEVMESLGLVSVLFIPACFPPHKVLGDDVPAALRLEMVELAAADNPAFYVSDVEVRSNAVSYTVDTLQELSRGLLKDSETVLILGSDAFREIHAWHRPELLFTLTDVVVVQRPGVPIEGLDEVLPVELARSFCYDSKAGAYRHESGRTVTYLKTTPIGISSSDIRGKIKSGFSVRYLMPAAVEAFISARSLYR